MLVQYWDNALRSPDTSVVLSTDGTATPSAIGSTSPEPSADCGAAPPGRSTQRRPTLPGRNPSDLLDGLEALVMAARAGQPGAMSDLVRRFTPLVRGVVRRAGVYGAEAEDIEQETWLRLTTNLDRVREPAALPRWLSVTTGRLCSNLFDKRRRVQPAGDFSEDIWPATERLADPADHVCLRDEMARLYDAIESLTQRDRTLIRMLMDAAPYREISDTISMPVGSIGPTRERVLRKLANTAALRVEAAGLSSAA